MAALLLSREGKNFTSVGPGFSKSEENKMNIADGQKLPLLRQGLPDVQRRAKRPAVVVTESKTQTPLIWQGRHSFVNQYDATLAPYSGCSYGCDYCYVPDVQWNLPDRLGGWGNYLNTRSQSVAWLRRHIGELDGTSLFLSATTDPYNPYEAQYRLTRGMLEVIADSKIAFVLVSTRGLVVLRDLDIFTDPRMRGRIEVGISIPSDLPTVHQAIEPYTPAFARRFEVAGRLKAARVPVRIHAAPMALHSPDFYTMAAESANWLWIDEPQHSANGNPELTPWFYQDEELRSLIGEVAAHPGFGVNRFGYGKAYFGWRWNEEQQAIVAPPARVKFSPAKTRKERSDAE